MAFDEVWKKIERYAGETFYELGGKTFTYEVRDESLKLSPTNKTIPRSNFERAYSSGLLSNLRQLKQEFGTQEHSYIFSILTDQRITKR